MIDSTGIGITIANEPNITEFEFNKQWLFAGAEQEWPDDVEKITVTLQRTCKTGDGQDVIETVTFDVTPKMTGSIDLSTISGSQISGTLVQVESQPNIYTYKITELHKFPVRLFRLNHSRTSIPTKSQSWMIIILPETSRSSGNILFQKPLSMATCLQSISKTVNRSPPAVQRQSAAVEQYKIMLLRLFYQMPVVMKQS